MKMRPGEQTGFLLCGKEWIDGEALEVRSPWDQGLVGRVSIATRADARQAVNHAVASMRRARALPRWKDEAKRRDAITWGGPVVAGGRLLVTGNNGEMLELAAADGEPISRLKLPAPTLLPPMIFGGTLYLLTEEAQLVAIRGA